MGVFSSNESGFVTTLMTGGASSVVHSLDQTRIFVSTTDGKIRAYDSASKTLLSSWDVGVSLGAISLSADGSYLVAAERNLVSGNVVAYKVSTTNGALLGNLLTSGNAIRDIQVINADYAIVAGVNGAARLNLADFTVSAIPGSTWSGNAVMTASQRYTLIAEPGTSDGPLSLYDHQTGTIVARNSSYQGSPGYNWGSQAISEAAGLIVQFIYYSSANVFDLNSKFIRTVTLAPQIDGMVFSPDGKYLYAFSGDQGKIFKYDTASWTAIDSYSVGTQYWDNTIGYGDLLTIDPSGRFLILMDDVEGKLQQIDLSGRDEIFQGTAGADSMSGGTGNDSYIVNDAGDTIGEVYLQGYDRVEASVDHTLSANVEALVLTGGAVSGTGNSGDNMLTGNALDNVLNGAEGNDVLVGGEGADQLIGGTGDDRYADVGAGDTVVELPGGGIDTMVTQLASATLAANVEKLVFNGSGGFAGTGTELTDSIDSSAGNGADVLMGLGGSDTLVSGAGNDLLDGGSGVDTMIGGAGDDSYVVDHVSDVVTEAAGEGFDTVTASVSYGLGANVEKLVLSGTAAINATGNGADNVLVGNSGANVLNGAGGADQMAGGQGDDTYVVDEAGDVVTELAGEGNDLVQSAVTFALWGNVEQLTLTGVGAVNGYGNGLDNVLRGNSAANLLVGGAGADVMIGGAGDDSYEVDSAGDIAYEAAGGGTDMVYAYINYALPTDVERLNMMYGTQIYGHGNASANWIIGNAQNNSLAGFDGDDRLEGGAGDDAMDGGTGNDVLIGGAGADLMIGGTGDDSYELENFGDVVVEQAGEGVDTVSVTFDYELGATVEKLVLIGGAVAGTGNSGANVLTGNGLANFLNGGGGADQLIGGLGDDTYIVDHVGDTVVEAAGEGSDLVLSAVGFTLSANVERLELTGNAAINGTGNALNNVLRGNAAANVLDGGAGTDQMIGGAGDDTYVVDSISDSIVEGAGGGYDRVVAYATFTLPGEVEVLDMTKGTHAFGTGNALDNLILGNASSNVLAGLDGNDRLDGGAGNDQLFGDNGNDVLIGGTGADQLTGGAGDDFYEVDSSIDQVVETADGGTADLVYAYADFVLPAHVENLVMLYGVQRGGTGNAGHNIIIGNARDNVIEGGAGYDTLTGGAGNDQFVIRAGFGTDVVTDFTAGAGSVDVVMFSSALFTSFAGVMANAAQVGNDTWIGDGLGNTLVLSGVAIGTLSADDFGFF